MCRTCTHKLKTLLNTKRLFIIYADNALKYIYIYFLLLLKCKAFAKVKLIFKSDKTAFDVGMHLL